MNFYAEYTYKGEFKKHKIKNANNLMHAKIALADMLKKKFGEGELVIHKCEQRFDDNEIIDFFNGIWK